MKLVCRELWALQASWKAPRQCHRLYRLVMRHYFLISRYEANCHRCIVQDDDEGKLDQVNNMDQIYLSACLTIVAGDTDSAFGGLTGFAPGSRTAQQNWANIAGLNFVGITPPIYDELKELPWHKRAWTYQGMFVLSSTGDIAADSSQNSCSPNVF